VARRRDEAPGPTAKPGATRREPAKAANLTPTGDTAATVEIAPASPRPTGIPAAPEKPRSGLMGALTAIFNGTMTLGRKEPEPTPPPVTSGVGDKPAARFGLTAPDRARLDGTGIAPPAVTTEPAGRSTTPSMANRVPGAPTSPSAKATNAVNATASATDADAGRKARAANAKGGKGKPGQG
jgi:hypothetical protein